jgi:hypothetical protein
VPGDIVRIRHGDIIPAGSFIRFPDLVFVVCGVWCVQLYAAITALGVHAIGKVRLCPCLCLELWMKTSIYIIVLTSQITPLITVLTTDRSAHPAGQPHQSAAPSEWMPSRYRHLSLSLSLSSTRPLSIDHVIRCSMCDRTCCAQLPQLGQLPLWKTGVVVGWSFTFPLVLNDVVKVILCRCILPQE